MTPWQPRDVIETPVDAVFDVNGWDLAKAVRLAAGGNATVAEWLSSPPFVYDGDPEFREALLSLAGEILDPPARVRRHYAHVGARQWERSGAHTGEVKSLKRVFYALRPAAVLHWMDLYDRPTPPMNLLELLDQAPPPPPDVRATVDELLATKAITREMVPGGSSRPMSGPGSSVNWTPNCTAARRTGWPARLPGRSRATGTWSAGSHRSRVRRSALPDRCCH